MEELRETVSEQLGLCAFHASLAVDQFAVTADAGGFYNARRAVAHIRMAVDVLTMMQERLDRDRVIADENRTDPARGAERRGERR